ncbi:helix-turn-helix transcriptional regulator [Actinoallomurus iriomotensis]|uniref:helix-turn-helix transcriptional regulator n=1 Tax=Actinoallomurus iriomotensis TaxID=478107 RepID=UPI002556A571|nr:DNA-binding protein [Actinoallomurus iriomotensis]
MTFPELFDLPTIVDLCTAGKAVGVSLGTAYKLVQAGRFPCPVMRLGHRYQVPTAGLMKALGIELVAVDPDDVADGAAFAARVR